MTIGNRFSACIAAGLVTVAASCSSSSSSDEIDVDSVVQNLAFDADGTTTIVDFDRSPGDVTAANFEADNGATPLLVTRVSNVVTIVWDQRVTPSHRVRVVQVDDVRSKWYPVTTSDPTPPTFTVTNGTQDTGDSQLGGDQLELTFTGPRVVEADAEDLANWELRVNGAVMDLTGSSVDLNPTTQVLTMTLGATANLHATFTIAATNLTSVADVAVSTSPVNGAATGDVTPPSSTSIEQMLSQDEFGTVVDFVFDEPMDPVFSPVPSNFSVNDHPQAIGVTLVSSVVQVDALTIRVTFSNPVVPGLDTISVSGLMDAHGNAYPAGTEVIGNANAIANAFDTVTATTVENVGGDSIVITTTQAFDPDLAVDPSVWSIDVDSNPIVMADQTLTYDLLTKQLTVDLDFDMVNGDTVDVTAVGVTDVDGDAFNAVAGQVNASGDAGLPTVLSVVQNRNVDPSGLTVDVTFSEDLHPTNSTDTANYTFSPVATVDNATQLGSGSIVRVVTQSIITPGDFTATIDGSIDDIAGNAMGADAGPLAITSTDLVAPSATDVEANGIEGADNDTVVVTFDDDMVQAEVESDANWSFESPVGNSVDVTGCTISYDTFSRTATLTLDAGGLDLHSSDDVQVSFTTMRDIGGNTITAGAIQGVIDAETTLPFVHTVWRDDTPNDDQLIVRFSEPCGDLDDLYDVSTNATGTRFAVRDSGGTLRGYPTGAAVLEAGLGVRLTYGFVITLTDTVDVIGASDLVGNVMFPSMDTPIAGADATAPIQGASPILTAVSGENNDTIVITFATDMSPWKILDPANYTVVTNPGGLVVDVSNARIEWDGAATVTLHLDTVTAGYLDRTTDYDVTLNVDATNPLRSEQGVPIGGPDLQGNVAVVGDTTTGPSQGASVAVLDQNDPMSIVVVFDEAVDQTQTEVPANFDYDTGNLATSVSLIGPRSVRATFAVPVFVSDTIVVSQASTEDLAGNTAAGDITLAIASDTTAPLLVSVSGTIQESTGGDVVDVVFTEQVDVATAQNPSNYSVVNGSALSLAEASLRYDSTTATVSIQLPDGIELDATSGLTVTVTGVEDVAGNAMPSPVNLGGTVSGDSTPPDFDVAFTNYREDSLGTVIDVLFDEDVDVAYAGDETNWSTSGAMIVNTVTMISARHARLQLSGALLPGETVDLLAGLEDLARNPTVVDLSVDPIDPID